MSKEMGVGIEPQNVEFRSVEFRSVESLRDVVFILDSRSGSGSVGATRRQLGQPQGLPLRM